MRTTKKLSACMLALIIAIAAIPFTVIADGAIAIAASGTTTITTATQMTCYGGAENHNGSGNYGFCTGSTATATIDVAETGIYTVEATGAVRSAKDATYDIKVDGTVASEFIFWGNGNDTYTIEVADVALTAGTHTLQLAYVAKAGVYNYLTELKFTKKASDYQAIWIQSQTGTSLGSSGAAHEMFYVSSGGSVQYTVNAPKAGTYQMAMKVARVDSANNNYTVTVNGLDATGEKSVLPQNNASTDPFNGVQLMANMCEVDLKAGANTVVFRNNGAFMYFSYFKFDYLREAVSKDMRMQVRTYKNAYNAENGNAELRQDGGNPDNTLWQVNGWAEYEITVSEPASYDVGLTMGGSPGGAQSYKIFVDGVEKIANTVTPTYQTAYTERVDTVFGTLNFFEAGTYTVKFLKTDGGFGYVDHVFFIYKGEASRDIRMQVRTYKNAYNAENGNAELRQDGASANNTIWQVGGWAEYDVDFATEGTYALGLSFGGSDGSVQTVRGYVDGVEAFTNEVTHYCTTAYTERVDTVYGNISVYTPGVHTIKIEKVDGGWGYVDHVFLNYVGEPAATPEPTEEPTEAPTEEPTETPAEPTAEPTEAPALPGVNTLNGLFTSGLAVKEENAEDNSFVLDANSGYSKYVVAAKQKDINAAVGYAIVDTFDNVESATYTAGRTYSFASGDMNFGDVRYLVFKVTAQNGDAAYYKVTINFKARANVKLRSVFVSGLDLPTIGDATEYDVRKINGYGKYVLAVRTADSQATVEGYYFGDADSTFATAERRATTAIGIPKAELVAGSKIYAKVIAQDGVTEQVYTFTVTE